MTPQPKAGKVKAMKAWADVGSNGGIFYFAMGEIAVKYPTLLQIYMNKVSDDLVPVLITPLNPKGKKVKGQILKKLHEGKE